MWHWRLNNNAPGRRRVYIDIDAESIDYANTCNLYNNISFECKSANEVTDIYDVIIASEIIEHIDNPVDFLMSLKNRLSKDGIIIITTPNGYGWSENEARMLKRILRNELLKVVLSKARKTRNKITLNEDNDHVQEFSFTSINKIFEDSGLEVIGFKGGPVFGGPFTERTTSKIPGFKYISNLLGDLLPPKFNLSWYFVLKNKQ